jgi:hypothetical protein
MRLLITALAISECCDVLVAFFDSPVEVCQRVILAKFAERWAYCGLTDYVVLLKRRHIVFSRWALSLTKVSLALIPVDSGFARVRLHASLRPTDEWIDDSCNGFGD